MKTTTVLLFAATKARWRLPQDLTRRSRTSWAILAALTVGMLCHPTRAASPEEVTAEEVRAGAGVSVSAEIEDGRLIVTWSIRNISDRLLIVPTRYFTRDRVPNETACTRVDSNVLELGVHFPGPQEWHDRIGMVDETFFIGRIGLLPGDRFYGGITLTLPFSELRCHPGQRFSSEVSQDVRRVRLWLELALWPLEWSQGGRLDGAVDFAVGKEFLMEFPKWKYTARLPFEVPLRCLRWNAKEKRIGATTSRQVKAGSGR